MKILILQLSDIHLRAGKNIISDRIDRMRGALQEADPTFTACFIAVTGDIAWSGQLTEYNKAYIFFETLRTCIKSINSKIQVETIFVPGNHDCDFSKSNSIRGMVLENLLKNGSNNLNEDMVNECTKVQDPFFDFLACCSDGELTFDGSQPLRGFQRLFYKREFRLDDHPVKFNCYNTAWMTQLKEQQGQLLFPANLIVDDDKHYDLVISLFHHPYNWLEANNAKAFRKAIEQSSDVVMTGHEHVAEQFNKRTVSGVVNEYFEGAILQSESESESGFNIFILDLIERKRKVLSYSWQTDHYSQEVKSDWALFARNMRLGTPEFVVTEAFNEYLTDVGAAFTHSQKNPLSLEDIFLYPDLRERSYARDRLEDFSQRTIHGQQVLDYVDEHEHVIIMGREVSGKTTLCKALYLDLEKAEYVPLRISGERIKSTSEVVLTRELSECIAEQYGEEMVEYYHQLDNRRKVLLIDDFHRIKLNRKGLNKVLTLFDRLFRKIIIFAGDLFQIEEITKHNEEQQSILFSFHHLEIQELGYELRGRIIEKWITLGQEDTFDEMQVAHRIRDAERLVTTLLGKNLLPAYPIFILSILQLWETNAYHNTALGAYGYHYEVLVNNHDIVHGFSLKL